MEFLCTRAHLLFMETARKIFLAILAALTITTALPDGVQARPYLTQWLAQRDARIAQAVSVHKPIRLASHPTKRPMNDRS
jgi:hypothetical protein